MKKTLFLLIIGIILIPNLVFADGGVFPNYSEKVYLPAQKAVISWDGSEEILILSTKISTENLANLAWVIPIPSKTDPEVEEGDIEIFYDLADLFSGKRPGTFGVSEKVEVVEIKKVDIYDIAVLKTTDAAALVDWLNENGYIVPESTTPILEEYCRQEDFYFIANKINLANKYQDLIIKDEDKACAEMVGELVSEAYYIAISEAEIFSVLESLKEEGECQEVDFEAVKILVELKLGIATPLKITFQPKTPFYPLKISSINDGDTEIDVYLFSETPVKDKSGILSLFQMTENTSVFKNSYRLGQKYVTYLNYSGDLKDLSSDSWFEPTEYDKNLDPNHVILGTSIFWSLMVIVYILIYCVVPIVIAVLVIIGLVVLIKKIIAKIKKR